MAAETSGEAVARLGRQPVTSVHELSHIALQLFIDNGFDATTVDDVARAAGIGRRTFFRYFSSKNDLPWGEFDALIEAMRRHLAGVDDAIPLGAALRDAVLDFNRYPADELPYHRERMTLLLTVPTLVAHSTLRFERWRQAIAEFAARRLGSDPRDLAPQAIGWASLGASLSAYESWLRDEHADLLELLSRAFDIVGRTFGAAS